MNNDVDDAEDLIAMYRLGVHDTATPAFDHMILAAAARRSVQRRLVRRAGAASLVAIAALLAVRGNWYAHQSNPRGELGDVTDAGAIEGLTRSYLLQLDSAQYSGPGSAEGAP